MPDLHLSVLSLRYSSWSMRPRLALTHVGANFDTTTAELPEDLLPFAAALESSPPVRARLAHTRSAPRIPI